jgi:hypothetical protein
MTYHRTAGKGGTRNRPAGGLPNYNKRQGSGARRRGKLEPNAAPSKGNFPPGKTQDTDA